MQIARNSRVWTSWIGVGSLLGSCSLALDWDVLQKCDAKRRCEESYSCLGVTCVPDHSLGEDDTCTLQRQCQKALFCRGFACRRPCDAHAYYTATAVCGSQRYCMPVLEPGKDDKWVGACIQSEACASCNDEDACVKLGSSTHACVQGCTISWEGGRYRDSCKSTILMPQVCQAIGPSGSEALVCLPSQPGAAEVGDPCTLVENPCAPGLSCHEGTCHRHCNVEADPSETCESSEACCEIAGTFGICC